MERSCPQLKWEKSKKSLIELGKLLRCEACHILAVNPHVLGTCDHTFCYDCTRRYIGKACPTCKIPADAKLCQPDRNVENLIIAYRRMAKFLGIGEQEMSFNNTRCNIIENSKSTEKGDEFVIPKPKRQRKNSIKSLDSSISTNTKLDKRNAKGETLLHAAAVKGNTEKVLELLKQGANPNTKDNAGWTPLHDAISKGHENVVLLLLQHGANPNIPGGDNETPLHDAVALYKLELVHLLVSNGADVNARNGRGLTPRDLCQNEIIKAALEIPAAAANKQTCQAINLAIQQNRSQQNGQVSHLFGINFDRKMMQELSKLSRILGFKVVQSYSANVTHVLMKTEDSDAKKNPIFYSAVLNGQWIVDYKWIEESEKENYLKDPAEYELDGTLSKVLKGGAPGRLNSMRQLPGLFNNCFFFLQGQFTSQNKNDITTWIKLGGGNVLSRMPNPENIVSTQKVPYHAKHDGPLAQCSHYILYDQEIKPHPALKYNMKHLKSLPIRWFVSCIEQFSLIEP